MKTEPGVGCILCAVLVFVAGLALGANLRAIRGDFAAERARLNQPILALDGGGHVAIDRR